MRLILFALSLVLVLMIGMKIASRGRSAPPPAAAHAKAPQAAAPQPHPADPHQYTVSERGIGPVVLGASLDSIEKAIGEPFRLKPWSKCEVDWLGAPQGVQVAEANGDVSRIHVNAAGVMTDNGVGIGDDSLRVREVYSALGKTVDISAREAVVELGSSTLVFYLGGGRVESYHLGRDRYDRTC